MEKNTIYIFSLCGGLTNQKRAIVSIIHFCETNKLNYSIDKAACRKMKDSMSFNQYDFKNMFDENIFLSTNGYIKYEKIKRDINNENSYNFFGEMIKNYMWQDEYKNYLLETGKNMMDLFKKCDKKYILMGDTFLFYYDKLNPWNYSDEFVIKTLKQIKPSEKILSKYKKISERLGMTKYNFLHYRYERDWQIHCKKNNIPFICPQIDILIEKIPFKNNLPIYLSTSNIESLNYNKLMKNQLTKYDNILYKKYTEIYDLTFDECAYIDYLFSVDSTEVYGFSGSDFSTIINSEKGTNNYYNELKMFTQEH